MSSKATAANFDLLVEREFLDAQTCARIAAEMCAADGRPATVYGRGESGTVDERVRMAARVAPSREAEEIVRRLLLGRMRSAAEHFGVPLVECEEPQFLRYGVGGHFVAHQDGNTGLLRSEREGRRVSAVLFINSQSETPAPGAFCGGSLVFHGRGPGLWGVRHAFAGEAGTLVLFRAETTHEVTPVTHGERLSVACWYR